MSFGIVDLDRETLFSSHYDEAEAVLALSKWIAAFPDRTLGIRKVDRRSGGGWRYAA